MTADDALEMHLRRYTQGQVGIRKMSTLSWKQEEERKGVQGTRGELIAADVGDGT